MAWDFRMDLETKDWVFTANQDYSGISETDLVRQLIVTRLYIDRGSFVYDEDGNLGSRLRELLSLPHQHTHDEISILIQEALAPMDEIEIESIDLYHPEGDEHKHQHIVASIHAKVAPDAFEEEFTPSPLAETQSIVIEFPI